jgi:hypothetical protein
MKRLKGGCYDSQLYYFKTQRDCFFTPASAIGIALGAALVDCTLSSLQAAPMTPKSLLGIVL